MLIPFSFVLLFSTDLLQPVGSHLPDGVLLNQETRKVVSCDADVITSVLYNATSDQKKLPSPSGAHWTISTKANEQLTQYQPLQYLHGNWYGSSYWSGPDWTRVGKNWQHTGQNTASVRTFEAPKRGTVAITGRMYKADTNKGGGDGVRGVIRHQNAVLWSEEIAGNDTRGASFNLTVPVEKHDRIRFELYKRKEIAYDTTYWDPVIAYEEGPAFRASDGFSGRKKGSGCWDYEMVPYDEQPDRASTLYWFSSDFALQKRSLQTGQTVSLRPLTTLPFAVLVFGEGGRGIVVGTEPNTFCALHITLSDAGSIGLDLLPEKPFSLKAHERKPLPALFASTHKGHHIEGMRKLQELISSDEAPLETCRQSVADAYKLLCTGREGFPDKRFGKAPSLDFFAMIQEDWEEQDKCGSDARLYRLRTAEHLERARSMIEKRSGDGPLPQFLEDAAGQLAALKAQVNAPPFCIQSARSLYFKVRLLKRHIALSHPLMRFGELLFCKRVPTSYSHLVMQYFGWRARPGGGLYILEEPGFSPAHRRILPERFEKGNVLEPRLSFDGNEIVFSFVRCPQDERFAPQDMGNTVDEGRYHIYRMKIDGTDLTQLTRGPWDDLMPAWLPDGGIVFSSTRRRGYARCFGGQFSRRWHVYTLHRMDRDGTSLRTISFHDTNEWFPAVSAHGNILYSRWDYIDRDAVTHQNLWAVRPDGTNPVALWGNAAPSPHCTFQIQPVPNADSYVFTASAHHSIAGGSIVLVDPDIHDDSHLALTRITPEVPFPEAESRNIRTYYAAPWPLSETHFLVAYSPYPLVWEPGGNRKNALGIYLLDRSGNRELLFRDSEIGSTNPCPLRPRRRPPVVPDVRSDKNSGEGELCLVDVYQGLEKVKRGAVKQIRVVQIFPKTTPVANSPAIGIAGEENARAVLGTVAVASDGSARFKVPAETPLLFQALDADGFAVQTMRSLTYLQRGERLSCIGCHENRMTAPPHGMPEAMQHPPSALQPGPFGGRPLSFTEVVQPVLDRHCIHCHSGKEKTTPLDLTGAPFKRFTRSYVSLATARTTAKPGKPSELLVPRFAARNQVQTTPAGGEFGAKGSALIRLLKEDHYNVELTREEYGRIALWIDCNAVFYGAYDPEKQAQQREGKRIPMPSIQ